MDDLCTFNPCLEPVWMDGYCRFHRSQIEYGTNLSPQPMHKIMWLVSVADGIDPGRDEHGCIVWPFSRNPGGYGFVSRRFNGKMSGTNASRLLCELIHGVPPDDGQVWEAAHECGRGRQACVTPEHLTWKTRSENEADKVRHDTIAHGARNPNARLTEDKVREILLDDRKAEEIAVDYGVTRVSVSRIKRGGAWRRVYDQVIAEGHTVAVQPTGGRSGLENHNAALTSEEVAEIRASSERVVVLAERYQTSESTVRTIRRGESRVGG